MTLQSDFLQLLSVGVLVWLFGFVLHFMGYQLGELARYFFRMIGRSDEIRE